MDRLAAPPATSAWELHAQNLRRQFEHSSSGRCLLWVNPAQRDPFDEDNLVQVRKVQVPILHPRFDPKFAPYLVALDLESDEDSKIFEASIQLAWEAWTTENLRAFRGQPIAGWIVTDKTPEMLARHWGAYTHLHFQNGLSKLLRFHDPSVREWLWPTLSPTQQQQLLGPAVELIAFNRQQELMHHRASAAKNSTLSNGAGVDETLVMKLTLTPAQWNQVDEYATVHGAWLAWHDQQAASGGTSVLPVDWQSDVFGALVQATKYGISDPQDRELFATHTLQLGPCFHLQEKFQTVWDQTRAGHFYGGVLEELSDLILTN